MSLISGFIFFLGTLVIVNKFWCFWSRSKVCLVGKTAIVTGGASGLGFQIALALASKGCRVIIADIVNISEAVESIKKETYNLNIIGKKMDLGSLKSVREFAKDTLATEHRLDILYCHGGIGELANEKYTEDGLQRTMHINYFGHFLLTHLLLDLLKKSRPSRIIFTSSQVVYISSMTIEALNPEREYFHRLKTRLSTGAYHNSKFCMAAAAIVFGEKLKGTGVTATAALPGGVKSSIFSNLFKHEIPLITLLWAILVYIGGKNVEEGAQTLIHLGQSNEVRDITGELFIEGMRAPRPRQLHDKTFCEKIWEKSIECTRLEPHEIKC